jgi:hypothetical protein
MLGRGWQGADVRGGVRGWAALEKRHCGGLLLTAAQLAAGRVEESQARMLGALASQGRANHLFGHGRARPRGCSRSGVIAAPQYLRNPSS